jgi:hypothetical protein
MTPRETFLNEMQTATESAIRSELGLFNIEPSEIISRDLLINILAGVYFE